jgi:DNA-directed RNA polymerase specialized sigma54-like protein
MLENPLLEVDEFEPEPLDTDDERHESSEEERAWDEWLDMYDELDSTEFSAQRDPNEQAANTEEFVGGTVSFSDYLEAAARDDGPHRRGRRRRACGHRLA